MAELFDRDVKIIGKHVNNALKEELEDQVVSQNLRQPPDMVQLKEKRKYI